MEKLELLDNPLQVLQVEYTLWVGTLFADLSDFEQKTEETENMLSRPLCEGNDTNQTS